MAGRHPPPLVGYLPTHDLDGLAEAAAAAWTHLDDLNYFLPIVEVILLVFAAYALGPAFLLASLVFWISIGIIRAGSPTV